MRSKQSASALRKEFEALVADDRAFDVKVVRSALQFVNERPVGPVEETVDEYAKLAEDVFGWVAPVLEVRAQRAEVDPSNVRWSGFKVDAGALAVAHLIGMVADQRKIQMRDGTKLKLDVVRTAKDSRMSVRGKSLSVQDWFENVLAGLPIYSRFVFDDGKVERREVALITTVPRALAYALAVLLADTWGLRERIRSCPYRRHGAHFFLDYRTDAEGRLLSGEPMKYCCPAHSNAHRQQLWRDARKAEK